jgi:hypothetical protein
MKQEAMNALQATHRIRGLFNGKGLEELNQLRGSKMLTMIHRIHKQVHIYI